MAVFAGGFTLEAAEAIDGGNAAPNMERTLGLLSSLVDKSLVQVEALEGEERYRLLEPIRQYARDRLIAAGEAKDGRDRHRDWFLQLAERAKLELIGPQQVPWLDRVERDHDNMRAALTWTVERRSADLAIRLAGALWRYWFARDAFAEGREWLLRALELSPAGDPTAARVEALAGASEIVGFVDDYPQSRRLAEEMLSICRTLGDRQGASKALWLLSLLASLEGDDARAEQLGLQALAEAREADAHWVVMQVLCVLGAVAERRGDYSLARHLMEESMAMCRELGDVRAIAHSLVDLAILICHESDYVTARAHLQEALTLARELGSNVRVSRSLSIMGILARLDGDPGQARTLLEASLSFFRDAGDRGSTGHLLRELGVVARAERKLDEAESLTKESLTIFRKIGQRGGWAIGICVCGILAIERGRYKRGVQLLGAANPRNGITLRLWPDERRFYEQSLVAAGAALGEEAFDRAWADGEAMTPEQAIAYALGEGGGQT